MLHIFRKTVAFSVSVLMLVLCACSSEASLSQKPSEGNEFVPTGESVSSSIFGQNIKYDGWAPAEELALPVDPSEITDMIQIEKILYLLTANGVYTLNLETAKSGKLTDSADFIAAHGSTLYTYSKKDGALCAYSPSGELISEVILPVESDELEIKDFFVTDDYYAFVCWDKSGDMYFTQYNAYSKATLELAVTLNEKKATYIPAREYCFSKGNTLLKLEGNSRYDVRYAKISEVDLDKGKITDLADVNVISVQSKFDIAYNPKTDTALVAVAPADSSGEEHPLFISEHSLSDPDNVVHQRFYFDFADNAKPFISIYENIVSVICAPNNEVNIFDYLGPPESITLACASASDYSDIIYAFEKETGVLVRTVSYGTDIYRLDVKLMAGDTDFDLFEPIYAHQHKYFLSGYYEDLANYEGLKQRLDSDLAAGFVSKLGDTYVGIPTGISESYSRETYSDLSGVNEYSKQMSRLIYLANNVDVTTGTFNDPDGSELYKLLKFYYDYPDGNEAKMPFGSGDDYTILDNGFVVMNPSSQKKDSAAKFLECLFDIRNGDTSDAYANIDTTENAYAYWHLFAWNYVEPIFVATNTVSQTDGKNSTLKELAREAATEVRMRLEE